MICARCGCSATSAGLPVNNGRKGCTQWEELVEEKVVEEKEKKERKLTVRIARTTRRD